MLVFSRKPNEQFQIGSNVTVTVRRVQGNRVWLAFEAPRSISIGRQELLQGDPVLEFSADLDQSRSNADGCIPNAEP